MAKDQKAEGKEETARKQNQCINQKGGVVRGKDEGARIKAEMNEHRRQDKSSGRSGISVVSVNTLSLPGSERSGIQMNEIRFGIVPHTAHAQGFRRVAELQGGQIAYPYVNGLTFHMQTMPGDAVSCMAQEFVGLWRPVSGYDIYGTLASCDRLNLAKYVEKRGVNGMKVTGAEIPEE